ncbi:MAG: efflux RND transporter periplasmic adaptor subunit, partial [Alphaproteobacteria bacterium]|nr:efflux RND transporter periplasmic adaptor subunit [Alphaproteobacteria bacterium]
MKGYAMRVVSCRAAFAGAALAALFGLYVAPAAAQGQAAQVEIDGVIEEPLRQTMPVIGRFVARQSGPVAALVSGPVSEILVDVGDRVAKGDVLVRLSTDVTVGNRNLREAELNEKKAALGSSQAQLRLARQELARLENLKKSAAFSQASYEDKRAEVARYQSSVAEANASVARAQANLELAELDMKRSEIRAPYNGVVVARQAVAGAYITTGAPVVNLVNDEDMEIEADVPAGRLAGLAPGRAVRAALDSGRNVMAVVRSVIPTENALTRTRPVRFTPQIAGDQPLRFATDQTVTVLLPMGEPRDIVSVHKDAVIARGAGYIVYVVEEGKAQLRQVELGEAAGNRTEVLSGLIAGDLV